MKIFSHVNLLRIIGALPALIIMVFIFKIFIFSDTDNWQKKYSQFSVPANSYPGGDSRNIQLTAYCKVKDNNTKNFKDCYHAAAPIVEVYPLASVPSYNYPDLWATAYGLFNNFSEDFFMTFWKVNALAVIITLFFLALRTTPAFFAIAALSPVTLLTIERGNVDALTFFILYAPILLTIRANILNGFFIILATSAKIFPIFALPIYLLRRFKKNWKSLIFGFLVASPLLVWSFKDILTLTENTSSGFKVAYGFFSLMNAPFLRDNHWIALLVLGLFFLGMVFFVFHEKIQQQYNDVIEEISNLDERKSFLFYSSIFIFGLTFIFFISWSYRLIFLFPAMFVLTNCSSKVSNVILCVMILVFWSPVLGWNLQNLMCYVLFTFLLPFYFRILQSVLKKNQ
mgnify:FL=1